MSSLKRERNKLNSLVFRGIPGHSGPVLGTRSSKHLSYSQICLTSLSIDLRGRRSIERTALQSHLWRRSLRREVVVEIAAGWSVRDCGLLVLLMALISSIQAALKLSKMWSEVMM